mmetsp:Transcript_14519/g.17600  ORF Transcript_14519/g.17600 Transcript_14519/m.17600 type:complete len:271 (+) Transcript_14519:196-1008(+)
MAVYLDILTKHLDHGLEGKPLRDILTTTKGLAELGSRERLLGQVLLICHISSDVSLLLSVAEIQRWHDLHTKLLAVLGGQILSIVCTIEVLTVKRALGSSHVTANDEVGATVVLANDHVLDSLTGTCHVHAVWQVCPGNLRIGGLLLQDHVGLVSHVTRDVITLSWSAGWVHQDGGTWFDIGSVKSTGEQLVVSPVDRVTALEGDHVLVSWELFANLCRSLAREITLRDVQSGDGTTDVVLGALGGNHEHTRVLEGGGAIAGLGLLGLVG